MIAASGMYRRPSLLILFIKFRLISICSQDESLNPVRSSSHLFADSIKRYVRTAFDDKFIVNMSDDEAGGESSDGMHQDVSADGLDNVFNEFRTVGFDAFPFLGSTDSFIGYGFSAILVFSNARLHVGEQAA